MNPSIGIAIVFFNKAQQTIECIRKFAKPGAPVYVLNNGSSAGSTQAVKDECSRHANVKFIHSNENLGCGGGRNLLIESTKDEWLFFVDNDITPLESHWLENLHLHVKHSQDIDAIIPVVHNIWDGTKIRPVNMGIIGGQAHFTTATSAYTNVFPGGASLISRKMFDRLGMYDKSLFAFEDFELSLRAERMGCPVTARHVADINLLHDHRIVTNADDRQAVEVRYSLERVGQAHDAVQNRYGVSFDKNYKIWLEQQILELTSPEWFKSNQSKVGGALSALTAPTKDPSRKSKASKIWRKIKSGLKSKKKATNHP